MSWGGGRGVSPGLGLDERRYAEVMRDDIEHKPQSLDPDEEFPEPSILEGSSVKQNTRRSSIYGLIGIGILIAVIIVVLFLFAGGFLI